LIVSLTLSSGFMSLFPDTLPGQLVLFLQIMVTFIAPVFFGSIAARAPVTTSGQRAYKIFDFFNPASAFIATGVGIWWWWVAPLRDTTVLRDSLGEWKSCSPGIIILLLNFGLHGHVFVGALWVLILAVLGSIEIATHLLASRRT
jgi:hypothetical protein